MGTEFIWKILNEVSIGFDMPESDAGIIVFAVVTSLLVFSIIALLIPRSGGDGPRPVPPRDDSGGTRDSFWVPPGPSPEDTPPANVPPKTPPVQPEDPPEDDSHDIMRLYIYQSGKDFWICRDCETENSKDTEICAVCGRHH
jgi:hypothetical protein